MDDTSYHKSKSTNTHLKKASDVIRCIFLPKYTPQLNPIEILWRDLKHALAGSYFDSIDELGAAIMDIVNNGELDPPKLMKYMVPEDAEPPAHLSCTMLDMTSEACVDAATA